MKILMLSENDPAGTGIMFANAINTHTDHSCRLVTKSVRYNFNYEKDIHIPDFQNSSHRVEEFENLLKESDIFHFHMTSDETTEFGPFRPNDFISGKMVVHHHHGHPDFRGNPEKYREKYQRLGRKNVLVSTPDLLHLLPGATWQPNLVPVDNYLYTPLENKEFKPVLIAHSPTRKELKNTREFLQTVQVLKLRGLNVASRLIEMTEHGKCLSEKRACHILFDHLQGYFGVSSLEGLSQGLAVVAGLDQWNREKIGEFAQTEKLPWFVSSQENLEKDLVSLVMDKDLRDHFGDYARRFMKAYWNDKLVVSQLIDFYKEKCR